MAKNSLNQKPKYFLSTLLEHLDIISEVYTEVSDQPFHENLFVTLLKRTSPFGFSVEDAYRTLESLKKAEIIEPVPMGDREYVFVHFSLLIIEGLLSQHKLSLQGELVVRIEALNDLLKKIENSINEHDLIAYDNACNDMDRLIRTIKNQTEEAKVAIFRLVEEAKLFPKDMPLKKRYAKTLDAWDEFVEPIIRMCDPNDKFSKTLSKIENTIADWADDESIMMLSLDSDRKRLHIIKARIIDFQDKIVMSASLMSKTIQPIVKMIRLNNQITGGATLGLRYIEATQPTPEWLINLGLGIKKSKSTIRHGTSTNIESFMLQIMNFDNSVENIPKISKEEILTLGSSRTTKTSEYEVINFMRSKLPAKNIYQTVIENFPEVSPKILITAIAKLARMPGYELSRDDGHEISIEHKDKIFTFKNRNIIKIKAS